MGQKNWGWEEGRRGEEEEGEGIGWEEEGNDATQWGRGRGGERM